jgi:AcrR family transcriptional regulator
MPKAFTEQEKQRISKLLLQQGHKQFAAFGLKKTSVEELASGVGISKGAFYLFYESKEALFMDVVEEAEEHFRLEVLATLALPAISPHARLFAALHKAFTLWKKIPILQLFTRSDYEILARRVPAATLQAHLQSDHAFAQQVLARCHELAIPVAIEPQELAGLLHALFFATLHEQDFGEGKLTAAIETLIHLLVAYCLGDVKIPTQAMVDLNPSTTSES